MISSEIRFTTLVGLLRSRASERPEREAFVFLTDGEREGARLTFAELDRRARAIAVVLRESLAPGERALLLYPPGLEFIAAFFGCLYAGVAAVPAYPPRLHDRSQLRLRAVARDAEPQAALTTTAILSALAASSPLPELAAVRWIATEELAGTDADLPDPEPESVAFLQYTSGSTASPKGVMVTHANLLHNEQMIGEAFRQDEDTVVVGWLPLYHDMGLIGNILQPLHAGAHCVLMAPVAFLQKPLRWLAAISRYRATTSGGPDFAYELCVRRTAAEQRQALDLSSWRVAFNGAEPVRAETMERFADAFAPCGFRREAFYPCYGLAEATLFVSGGAAGRPPRVETVDAAALERHEVAPAAEPAGARRLVSCGHAWAEQRIAIVDPETGIELGSGRVGEIWTAGPSVARGYWRNPAATRSDFEARLADTGLGPFLRTGDLGFLHRGELYVTGRLKDLIILRGRNHYPQDIELTAERSHPDLRPGGGAAFSVDIAGEERLVVAQEVERHRKSDLDELAEAIRRGVAEEHEVQVHDVVLARAGTVPKTSSGKVQRRLCRDLYLAGELAVLGRSARAEEPAPAPAALPSRDALLALPPDERRALLERSLRERSAAALGVAVEAVDPQRPLMALGLDSLAAMELKGNVEAALGVELPLGELLEGATTGRLVDLLLAGLEETAAPAPALAGEDSGRLSHGQRALWFLERLAPEGGAYNIVVAARVRGGLDSGALRRALEKLADRHAALHTVFRVEGDEPVRQILNRVEVDFLEDGWSEERLAEEAYRPFSLELGPLLRVRLAGSVLLLSIHHLVADFASLALLARELGALYRQETGGAAAALPAPTAGYGDFVRWQETMLAGPRGERLWAYWREALAGVPDLDLPADRPRLPVQTWRGTARFLELPPGLADSVRSLGAAHGATLFATLLAAFQAQLGRYSGQSDFAVGSPTAGRSAPEHAGIAGYFVNPIALRADLSGDPGFAGLLDRVRRTALAGLEHADFPFALAAERLRPERDAARSPIFQTMLVLQRLRAGDPPDLALFALGEEGGRIDLGGLALESARLAERRAQFDLTLRAAELPSGGLGLSLEGSSDLFDAATAGRMLEHLRALLAGAAADPACSLSLLPLLSGAERRQVLVDWNAAPAATAPGLLHERFEEQAARTPDAEALVVGTACLSYAELNRRANRLARHLRAQGVGPEVRVGVRLQRSAELVVSLLAVLKAGGAYVPLDPSYPAERLALMTEDSGAEVVISAPWSAEDLAAYEDSDLNALAVPENLAYLIYTSGSTGRPKAVAIEHRSASVLVGWARGVFSAEELAGVLAATSVGFDLSVFELFVPLSWGGRVILAGNALELPWLPAAAEVRLVNTVPSAMAELARGGGLPASVRTVNLAGEPVPPALVDAVYGIPGVERLYNLYGPSEDTTYSTFALLSAGCGVTVGRPIDGTQAYLLEAGGEPVPVGIPGELYLGGEGLARGYLGRPELTAERFVPDPFGSEPGARLYRTGDLARWRSDGEIDFLGRADHQVKVRGFRIELGEIEAALARHPGVREAVAAARDEGESGRRLVAYVVPRDGGALPELRDFLRRTLPEFMVPSIFVRMAALPLSPNGKVDRKALPAPGPAAKAPAAEGPRTPLEELLAGIFAEVLGVERVGLHDDFFDLGGHSLLATRMASRMSRLLGVEPPLSAFFQAPTVAGLAARLGEEAPAGPPLQPLARDGRDLPLSFAQRRLWFLDLLEPGTAAYNLPGSVRLEGRLDVTALAAGLGEAQRRHEALRTVFPVRDGEPVQIVEPAAPVAMPLIDLSGLPGEARDGEAERLAAAEARTPFDLARGPVWRVRLLRLGAEDHRLVVNLHHIAADGWSLGLLLREIAALYAAFSARRRSPLPDLPVQYADFSLWQRGWLAGGALEGQLAYWRQRLAGLPVIELPADRPRPAVRDSRGAVRSLLIPPELSMAVERLARRQGSTLFMTLLAAFQTLLARYTGEGAVPVGSPIANRRQVEIEPLVGFFVNTLVLAARVEDDPPFRDLLARVREACLGAYAHQDLPFELLVEALHPDRDLSQNPLFQVLFVVEEPLPVLRAGEVSLTPRRIDNGTAKFDLTLAITPLADGGWLASAEYAVALFDPATIDRLLGHYRTILEGAVAGLSWRLSELSLSGPLGGELQRLGKVDRKAPARIEPAASSRTELAEPRTPREETVAGIWREVLGVERFGIHDDFFDLGGHSLLAMRAVFRVAEVLGVDVPVSVLFQNPTVARLAAWLDRGAARPAADLATEAQPETGGADPLSPAQQRLWLIDRMQPGTAAYNLLVAARLTGDLAVPRLAAGLREVVRRHEPLRTVYAESAGEPIQIVLPAPEALPLPLVDLGGLPAPEREPALRALLSAEAARPFDLQRGPVARFLLARLGAADHALAAAFHHIAADGWSMEIFFHELAALYRGSSLPELPLRYADHASWQRRTLRGDALAPQISYWQRQLAGAPALELPGDRPRPASWSYRGMSCPLELAPGLADDLRALGRAEGGPLFPVLLAGFFSLLARHSGQDDLCAGVPLAGRDRPETQGLIGLFVNTLVLRVEMADALSVRELVRRVRDVLLDGLRHQDVPFEKLVEVLQPERVSGVSPLFQALFSFLSAAGPEEIPDLQLDLLDVESGVAKFDLACSLHERAGRIRGWLECPASLFEAATAVRLRDRFVALLRAAADAPDRRASELELLAGTERHQLLLEWRGTFSPQPGGETLAHLFAAQAERTPEAVALLHGGESLTYRELSRWSDRLARRLRALGVGTEDRVGLLLERSPAMVAGILGVWKSGAAYVPLDPSLPAERLAWMVRDLRLAALVAPEARAGWDLPVADPGDGEEPGEPVLPAPGQLAYLIYTSGTTGSPKAVMVEHRSLARTLLGCQQQFGFSAGDRMLHLASFSFDISLVELFMPLLAGGTVELLGRDEVLELPLLIGRLRKTTRLHSVPSLMRRIVDVLRQRGGAGDGMRTVFVGGERVPPDLLADLREAFPAAEIVVLYGPTEATIVCAALSVPAAGVDRSVLGRPLPGAELLLLDRWGNPAPLGVPGELLAGGPVVTRGYRGRPDLTAERYVPAPGGRRLYRTGDLARHLPDGVIEFLGRVDQQVKIRGFRVEPAEIEAALRACPGVREAVVAASGEARLAAYIVPADAACLAPEGAAREALFDRLRAALADRLPDHMVPSAWAALAALPLSPHGKVDRRALPAPEVSPPRDRVLPRTPAEERLAAVWSEVLGVEPLGVNDDFFALGGHSLLAVRLIFRIAEVTGVEVPVKALFENPTVARLAAWLEKGARPAAGMAAAATEASGAFPLSLSQRRLWLIQRLDPDSTAYHQPVAVRLSGELREEPLAWGLVEILRRHEPLRTVFAEVEGEPVQIVLPPPAAAILPRLDLSALPAPERWPALRAAMRADLTRPFDLERGPMARFFLARLEAADHVLAGTFHHIASDGWSLEIFFRELVALYGAALAGRPSPLPELPLRYADFALWQERALTPEALAEQLAYWRRQLAGAPVLELPTDYPRPAGAVYPGANRPLTLPPALTGELRALGRGEGITPFAALLAAFAALMGRYGGQDDVPVGIPSAGRSHRETAGMIGFFVNTLVIRARLESDPPFRDLASAVRDLVLAAQANQDVPFDRVVEELQPERDPSVPPLFQVMVAHLRTSRTPLRVPGLEAVLLAPETVTAKLDLLLTLDEWEDGVDGHLEYRSDLFAEATADRLLGHFRTLLAGAVADPSRRLSDLPLLAAAEREQLLVVWNDTRRDFPGDLCLHDLVAAQAARTPGAEAVVDREARLTYAELRRRANQLARHLRALGVGPEVRVAIRLARTPDLVVAILAALEAGGAYVPIDPSYPQERQELMLEDSGAKVLIGDGETATVDLARDRAVLASYDGSDLSPAAVAGNLAYLIYTSGSTGRPKAVAIEHRSAVTLVQWALEVFPAEDLRGVLFATSVCFDLSVFEMFVPLAAGGRVVVAEDALELPRLAASFAVTLVNTVPSAMAELARGALPASLRTVNLAGEPLKPELVERIYAHHQVERVYNLYGPSEDTTYSTFTLVRSRSPVTIGRPIANTRAYVVDRGGRLALIGVPGELWLGGDGLARGYLGRPELTAEKLVPDPFGDRPGERLYRTGDRVRRLPDGRLDFLGRIDHQVKIRGFRIELGEIEAALLRHPAVREAAVLAPAERDGGRRLLAWVVTASPGSPPAAELRGFLARTLPEYMVPSAFELLDALPRTPNGKVDHRALSRRTSGRGSHEEYAAPRTPVEETLVELWEEVLGEERTGGRVGVHDNFFALGGHSLIASRLAARIRAVLGAELPLRALFEAPTVAGLAERLEGLRGGRTEAIRRQPRRRGEPARFPVSFSQLREWILDRLEPGTPAYNIPSPKRIAGPVSIPAFARALQEVVRRHESLRTTFEAGREEPVQVVAPALEIPLPVIDLEGLPAAAREPELQRLLAADLGLGFDLDTGPLLRVRLVRLAGDDHALLLTMHHIVSDGWSTGVLSRELAALYEAFSAGLPPRLPELPVQYPDYAAWQRDRLQGERLEERVGYWRERLAGAPPLLELPADRPRPAVRTNRGENLRFAWPAAVVEPLKAVAAEQGGSLFMGLLAAFQALLARLSGQEDVAVGTFAGNRGRVELEGVIGFFINTLALRTDLSGEPSFREALGRVREVTLGAYTHQEIPFEKLLESLALPRDTSRTPIFQTMLVLQNFPQERIELSRISLEPLPFRTHRSNFDLTLWMMEEGGGLACDAEYSTDLFDEATVARMTGYLRRLIAAAAADPDASLWSLPLLSPAERAQILEEWSRTAGEPAGAPLLHRLFEDQASRSPVAAAVEAPDGTRLTYAELDARAGRLARHLRALGVGAESRVALAAERSPEMLVGMLAVLKAGGAYVPLDPDYPRDRLAFMLQDSGAAWLLTQERLAPRLPAAGARVVLLDSFDNGEPPIPEAEPEPVAVHPESAAYVIYTSGSMGRPKGVVVSHRAIAAYARTARDYYAVGPGDRVLQFGSISFDTSAEEIYPTLAGGATLVLRAGDMALSMAHFLREADRLGITLLALQTAFWHEIVAGLITGLELPASMRLVAFGGEEALLDRLAAWRRQVGPSVRLVNTYGPTEATIVSTYRELAEPEDDPEIPIGRAVPGARVYVLDRGGEPAPPGVQGELMIGGAGVARGYHGRPDLTAERFVPDPYSGVPGARLYRTGDLSRFRPDGDLLFCGRADRQLKLRGYRIEPGEIEAALRQHPAVYDAIADLRGRGDDKRLVAWVVPREGEAAPPAAELRTFLRDRLPEPMVPSAFVAVPALPLTPSGKVDRRALPEPAETRRETPGYVDPETELERTIAGIFRDLLRVDRVGLNDNFFELGGHSLLVVRAHQRLREALGREIPVVDLFRFPTVALLARQLGSGEEEEKPALRRVQGLGEQRRAAQAAQRRRQQAIGKTPPGRQR